MNDEFDSDDRSARGDGGWSTHIEPEPAAPTGVVIPRTGPRQRAALLTLKAQVERLTAAHEQVGQSIEALARNHRTLSGALNGLLSAITGVLKAQEQDAVTAQMSRQTGWVGSDFTEEFVAERTKSHPHRDALLEAFAQDQADNPRGHPCRDCGRYYDEHRGGGGDCGGWR